MAICYEFIGGPLDGKLVLSTSDKHCDALLAEYLHSATDAGTEGSCFCGLSGDHLNEWEQLRVPPQDAPDHMFEVAERVERNGVVHVRIRPLN